MPLPSLIAHATLLNVMWQPGWEESLRQDGYIFNIWLRWAIVHGIAESDTIEPLTLSLSFHVYEVMKK